MMKTYVYYGLLVTATVLAGSLLSGCGEEYLEEAEVYRDLDATNAYETPGDAVLAVSAAYTPLQYQGLYRRYRY